MQGIVYECTDMPPSRLMLYATSELRQMNVGNNKVYHQPKLRPLSTEPEPDDQPHRLGTRVSTDSWSVAPDTVDTRLVTGHSVWRQGARKWREDVWAESWASYPV